MVNWNEKIFGNLTLEDFFLSFKDPEELKIKLNMSFIEIMRALESKPEEELKKARLDFKKMSRDAHRLRNKAFIGQKSYVMAQHADKVVKEIEELLKKFK